MPSPVPTFLVGTGEGTGLSAALLRGVGFETRPYGAEQLPPSSGHLVYGSVPTF